MFFDARTDESDDEQKPATSINNSSNESDDEQKPAASINNSSSNDAIEHGPSFDDEEEARDVLGELNEFSEDPRKKPTDSLFLHAGIQVGRGDEALSAPQNRTMRVLGNKMQKVNVKLVNAVGDMFEEKNVKLADTIVERLVKHLGPRLDMMTTDILASIETESGKVLIQVRDSEGRILGTLDSIEGRAVERHTDAFQHVGQSFESAERRSADRHEQAGQAGFLLMQQLIQNGHEAARPAAAVPPPSSTPAPASAPARSTAALPPPSPATARAPARPAAVVPPTPGKFMGNDVDQEQLEMSRSIHKFVRENPGAALMNLGDFMIVRGEEYAGNAIESDSESSMASTSSKRSRASTSTMTTPSKRARTGATKVGSSAAKKELAISLGFVKENEFQIRPDGCCHCEFVPSCTDEKVENSVKTHRLGQDCAEWHMEKLVKMKEAGDVIQPEWQKLADRYVETFNRALDYEGGKIGKKPKFYSKTKFLLANKLDEIKEFLGQFDP